MVEFVNIKSNNEILKLQQETSLQNFAKALKISSTQIIHSNTETNLKKGTRVIVNYQKKIIHIVLPGQTLQLISHRYNKPPSEILKNNNCKNIFNGQQLLI